MVDMLLMVIFYGIALRVVPTILLFTQWIPSEDDKAGDDDAAPLTTRQTTVGFLREIGQVIDLKRIKSQNTEIQQLVKDQWLVSKNDNFLFDVYVKFVDISFDALH